MEQSAPKRRRTSPTTSVAIHSHETNASALEDGASLSKPRVSRPSFASPTRASLARSNPAILERRMSGRRASEHRRSASQASDVSLRDLTTTREPDTMASQQSIMDPEQGGGAQSPTPGPRRPRESSLRNMLTARLEQARGPSTATRGLEPSDASSSANTPTRHSTQKIGGRLGMRPKRSPAKPNPRPLPPAETGAEEELLKAFGRRGLRRTPPPGQEATIPEPDVEPQPEHEPEHEHEPELPPTPTQQGREDPVVTTPPEGIHDTPSRRTRRRSDRDKKTSPLKQVHRPMTEAGPSKRKAREAAEATVVGNGVLIDEDTASSARGGGDTHPARGIPLVDAHSEKRARRDQLQAELARLEADLEFASQENERLRTLQSQRRGSKPPLAPPLSEELLGLFQHYLLPAEEEKAPDMSQLLFDAAMDPNSWFSFGAAPTPIIPAPKDKPEPPVSHNPIPMTADEELAFLKVFTPFDFTSSTTILPRENLEEPLMRQYTISVHEPSGFFAAKIEMVVNSETLRIEELRVPRLEPAAIAELGPFVETICKGKQNSAMDRNVGVLCWAMSEWYRVSAQRARVWCQLETDLGDAEQLLQSVRQIRSKKRGKKRKVQDEDDEAEEGRSGVDTKKFSRASLLAHMGRTSFEIPIPEEGVEASRWPCLRIQWRIQFDWTGEGTSKLGVLVGVPGKWRKADSSGALFKVQKVFGDVIQGDGNPLTAVRTVVALLAGDPSTRG